MVNAYRDNSKAVQSFPKVFSRRLGFPIYQAQICRAPDSREDLGRHAWTV